MTRCGYAAIIGRPNVGKSTLMNYLLGQKISITSRKPQTTRHSLVGIKTLENTQIIYVDTPGLHQSQKKAMNRYLNRAASNSIDHVDVIVWLVEADVWTEEDDSVLQTLMRMNIPVIVAVNKVDRLADKNALLPYLEKLSKRYNFHSIYPISALKQQNIEALEKEVAQLLPENPFFFPEDQITDRSERFLVSEIIREKLTRRLGEELPYQLSVQVELYETNPDITNISAVIWVERSGQKGIVIGKQGKMLKSIGQDAREDIEIMIDSKVYLQLWVKVKEGWSDDERALRQLGYFDE